MQDAEKVEIGYTLPKERWQEAAKNLEDLGNALAASLRAHNKDGLGAEDVLPSMENGFALKQILLFPRKRSVIIIQVSAGFSQRSLATGKFLLMSRILKKETAQNVYFSAQSFQKI